MSLTRRVVFLSSLWVLLAIILLGWFLVGTYRHSVDSAFNELQLAHFYGLVGAVSIDSAGQISGSPDLGDANFRELGSGWYWEVRLVGDSSQHLTSPSLGDRSFDNVSLEEIPYQKDFSRRYSVAGPWGHTLRIYEAEIELSEKRIALFRVAGSETRFVETINDYTRQIASLLGVFALGLVILNGLVILYGLRPLDRLTNALSAIRNGSADKLEGEYPSEIQPLADELNAMIDNNRRILERARMQVGNLAHSLKTPLAVLQNAADTKAGVNSALVSDQAKSMQTQVQHYLNKARVAAQRDSVVYRTDVSTAINRIVSVFEKITPDMDIAFQEPEATVLFAGEKEDLEEVIGNLVENACRYGGDTVRIAIDHINNDSFGIVIEDNGPGIAKHKRTEALRRGARIDEAMPGSGLGLSIVVETIRSYGGTLHLDDAEIGGLRVAVILPRIRR